MKKPALVIMAAGMGSRYGGLKQIDPIDEEGHIIIDFSIYDARKAGFEKVIFVIKRENEAVFREVIGNRIEKYMEVLYIYQDLNAVPEGITVPNGRTKPWGTGHAILSCQDVVEGSFAVINADDYYGRKGFQLIYNYLMTHGDDDKYRYAMVGYYIEHTLSENGTVARGICELDEQDNLIGMIERTQIKKMGSKAAYSLDTGAFWKEIPSKTMVSMNLFGFTYSIFAELKIRFTEFLENSLERNPLKCEFFIPFVVDELLQSQKAAVKVLKTEDIWYGVTYKEDKPVVATALKNMKRTGEYPNQLWES